MYQKTKKNFQIRSIGGNFLIIMEMQVLNGDDIAFSCVMKQN